MNKVELINEISTKTGLTKKDSGNALDAFMSIVKETLSNDGSVILSGFGKWETVTRAERKAHNPKTMEAIIVPSKKVPVFKAGLRLKESVNS